MAAGKALNISTNEGLSHSYVLSLRMDGEGSLWVGTDGGGLNRVRRQMFEVLEATRSWVVQSVIEDDEGGLWIGANGNDVSYWKNGGLHQFIPGGKSGRSCRSIWVDSKQRVWAGIWGGGLFQWIGNPTNRVYADGLFERTAAAAIDPRVRLGKLEAA